MKIIFHNSSYTSFLGLNYLGLKIVDSNHLEQKREPVACKETFSVYVATDAKNEKTFSVLLTNGVYPGSKAVVKPLKAKNTLDLLNKLETRMKFKLSKVYEIEKSPADYALAITSSSEWAKSYPLIHLYLLILRNASTHLTSNSWLQTLKGWTEDAPLFQATDRMQFQTVGWPLIRKIIKQEGDLPSLTVVTQPQQKYVWKPLQRGWISKITKKKVKKVKPEELNGIGICQFAAKLKLMNKGASTV